MTLRQALAQVLQYATPPPSSEAATLLRIIDPLLTAMGYTPMDIEPESTSTPGLRPDRTLLPDTDEEWYLEAKSWGVSLDDVRHLQQAVSYAHSRGRRWVVLTNGQLWRIYDDHLTGTVPAERLVAEARLDDEEQMEQLLTALSKQSMVSGQLGQFAIRARVRASLTKQLKDDGSEAIRALLSIVKRQPGLSAVTKRDIADYFQDMQVALQPQPALTPTNGPAADPGRPPLAPPVSPPPAMPVPKSSVALSEAPDAVTGAKPSAVFLPDGSSQAASSWRAVTCSVLAWLAANKGLPPFPFQGGHRGDRYFLNSAPSHKTQPMHAGYRSMNLGGQEVYVDLHRSAVDLVGRLIDLCHIAGVDPASIRISLM